MIIWATGLRWSNLLVHGQVSDSDGWPLRLGDFPLSCSSGRNASSLHEIQSPRSVLRNCYAAITSDSDSEAFHPSWLSNSSDLATVVPVSCVCEYPVCVQNTQPVHERHYSLLQRVQRVLLRVVVSEVVPQAPQRVSEQLHFVRLQSATRSQQQRSLKDRGQQSVPASHVTFGTHCVFNDISNVTFPEKVNGLFSEISVEGRRRPQSHGMTASGYGPMRRVTRRGRH